MKLFRRQITLSFLTLLALAGLTICLTPSRAEIAGSDGSTADKAPIHFVPPPPDGDPTGRQKGGGTRPSSSKCPKVDKPLTALVPATQQGSAEDESATREYVWGLTVDRHPTFWFYAPYNSPLSAKFVLQDEQENEFYSEIFPLPEKSGVVSIRLPSNKPLESGQKYKWFFSIVCDPQSPSANFSVEGWVKRVEPQERLSATLMSQLEKAAVRERTVLYAAGGIWYDALTLLGERRFTNPSDSAIASDWAALLEQVRLNDIAQEPIVQRYNTEK